MKGRFLYASIHTFGSGAHLAGRRHLEARHEDRTLLQQTANLLEDVRPREICAGVCGASGEGRLLMGELLSWLVNVFRDVWPGEAS